MRNEEQQAYRFPNDSVDEASRESFPASDPPSFMAGVSDLPEDRQPVEAGGMEHQLAEGTPEMSMRAEADSLQCCGGESFRTWGMLVAATAAGVVVGGLLADRYLAHP